MFPVRALLLAVHVVVALASIAIVPPEKFGCVLRGSTPKAYDGVCRSMKTKEECYNVKKTCVWVPPPPGIYATWSFHYGTGYENSGWLAKPLAPGSSEQATGWECAGDPGTFTCALSDTAQLSAHWTFADGERGDGPAVSSGCSTSDGPCPGYFFECCFSATPPPPPPPTPAPTPPPPPIQTLIKGLYDPENMFLDLVGGKVYFQVVYGPDPLNLHTKTQRANLNGSQLEDYKGDYNGFAMDPKRAVDVATGKLYETIAVGHNFGSVQRSNLDFSHKEILVTNLPWPTSIALDVTRGKVYWIDWGFPTYFPNSVGGSINRANLDGSNSEIIIKGNASWAVPADCSSIALDVESGKMYLNHPNFISRANLDGSAFENVVVTGSGQARLGQIALDKKGGWLYWAQPGEGREDGTIKRVALSNAMLV